MRYYLVALTVFAPDGTTIGTAQTPLIPTPPPPAIKKVSPGRGSRAGGTVVTIVSTGFTGAEAVRFSGSSAASFTVNSATSITAVTPPGAKGPVPVTVTTPWGTNAGSRHSHFKSR
ncbi:MAG TPA: IPT/TIG domain-containing protein [Solirubrobacteraceae bacterium]|jgi:hypothetical protein|nr:IPT/TIG domain-containing protein [Solirubrobacteraceae bacterium]